MNNLNSQLDTKRTEADSQLEELNRVRQENVSTSCLGGRRCRGREGGVEGGCGGGGCIGGGGVWNQKSVRHRHRKTSVHHVWEGGGVEGGRGVWRGGVGGGVWNQKSVRHRHRKRQYIMFGREEV